MGMFVVHGAQAGGFSPISIYGTITNSVMRENDLPVGELDAVPHQPDRQPADRGRAVRRPRRPRAGVPPHRRRRDARAGGRHGAPAAGAAGTSTHRDRTTLGTGDGADHGRRGQHRASPPPTSAGDRASTRSSRWSPSWRSPLIALVFDRNIGFTAITAAVILTALFPKQQKGAVSQVAWATVLLVAGVSTFATILETAGAPEYVGKWAAGLGAAVLGALILCYVGGVVSAFASSTALLPIIIPIAIPLITGGGDQRRRAWSRRSRCPPRSSTSARSPPTAR